MSTKEQRERFEAWFSDNGLYPKAIERDKRGYLLSTASTAWEAWQACTASTAWEAWQAAEAAAIERCAKVCDEWQRQYVLEQCCDVAQDNALKSVAAAIRALLPKEES